MTPILEIRHLRLVRAIAEEGGPTKAAARLHLTQSAVSHQLAELEGRLGVKLFARVRRQLKVTPAGQRVVDAARTLLSEIARLEQDVHRTSTKKRVVVRIAVETFTAYHFLPKVMRALSKELPHVDVRIVAEARREPIVALLDGTIDVALVCMPVRDRALVSLPLFPDEWTVILPPKHALAKRAWIDVADLANVTVFANDASRSDMERLRELLANERAPMPRVTTVPLTDALVEMVSAGLGVGLVSRWAIEPWEKRRMIVSRRFTRAGLHEKWMAVRRRDAPPEVARFVELVRAGSGG